MCVFGGGIEAHNSFLVEQFGNWRQRRSPHFSLPDESVATPMSMRPLPTNLPLTTKTFCLFFTHNLYANNEKENSPFTHR